MKILKIDSPEAGLSMPGETEMVYTGTPTPTAAGFRMSGETEAPSAGASAPQATGLSMPGEGIHFPKAAGFWMPGEYEPHRGTVLIWPVRPGSWPFDGNEAKRKFCEIAAILSRHERVWMLADAEHVEEARAMLEEACGAGAEYYAEGCHAGAEQFAEVCGAGAEYYAEGCHAGAEQFAEVCGAGAVIFAEACGAGAESSAEACSACVDTSAEACGAAEILQNEASDPAEEKAAAEAADLTTAHKNEPNRGFQVLEIPTDDAWARDVGPTCIVNDKGSVLGIDWQFNAWGGSFDGLYADWRLDNAAAARICAELDLGVVDARDFVLEGGSIAVDGEGTVVVTACCLLSEGRNPQLTKAQIEARLMDMLGADKVIWLPNGIYNDETNGHVDNVFAFTAPGEAVLAWTDDETDPQYALSLEDLRVLEEERDARGRKIRVHKMLIPGTPICIRQEDLQGYRFAPGEDEREEGERLAASYVNFYIGNEVILVPQFGDPNDVRAVKLLQELFPARTVYPIEARCILVGGGNIHCITQQIPLGKLRAEAAVRE